MFPGETTAHLAALGLFLLYLGLLRAGGSVWSMLYGTAFLCLLLPL